MDRLDGSDHRGDAALHIDGAAPPDLSIGDLGRKWRVGPGGGVACGNDVDVSVQDQRAGVLPPGSPQRADEVGSPRVDVPAVDRASEGAQPRLDHILAIRLGAGLDHGELRILGRDANEFLGERDRLSLQVVRGLPQSLHHLCIDHVSGCSPWFS